MKKFVIINLLFLLLLTSVVSTVKASNVAEETLSNSITKLHSTPETKIDTDNPTCLTEIVDENGNVPAYEYYPNHVESRGISILKAYDGKIFMGLGDWNANTGPVKVLYYDTTDGKIKTSGTIEDEAIQQFTIIDDKLYTTGCDPRSAWGYGSYYVYNKEENKWDQHKKNNGWIHAFNIIEFKDKLYMCGSTVDTTKTSTIQSSSDNGETFQNVPVFKNGEQLPYNSSLRCYNLAVYNNKLYGYIYYSPYTGIYEYDEGKNEFHYISNLPSRGSSSYAVSSLGFYNEVYFNYATFNNEFLYISGNKFFKSTDLKNFKVIETNTKDVVQDVVANGDKLYTLSYAHNSDNTYTTRIYSTTNLEDFKFVYEFTSDTPPFAIEYYDNNLYIGTSTYSSVPYKDPNKLGTLYKVDLSTIKESDINNNNSSDVNNNIDNNNSSDVNNNIDINNNVNDYIDNNSKLPQTGKFFELKNLLQIIIMISIIFLIFIVVKGKNSKKN